jgi:PAS domain S-box-containing protein
MSDAVGTNLLSPMSYLFITGLLMILVGSLVDIVPPKARHKNHLMWLVPAFMFYGVLRILSSFELYKLSDYFILLDTFLKVGTILCSLEFIRKNLNSQYNKGISVFSHIPLGVVLTVLNSSYQTQLVVILTLVYTATKAALLYGAWHFILKGLPDSPWIKRMYLGLSAFLCFSQAVLFIAIKDPRVLNVITMKGFYHLAFLEYLSFLIIIVILLYHRGKFDYESQKTTAENLKVFIPTFICLFIITTSLIGTQMNSKILLQNDANMSNQVEVSTNNLAKALNEKIEFVSTAASIISNIPTVSSYFEEPSEEGLSWINKFLEAFNLQNPDSLCFLLNEQGIAIASSHQAELIVDYDFSFRRYFRRAISGQSDISLGTGLFTRIPGFYAAETIRSLKDKKILGVAVVKRNIEDSSQIFKNFHPALLLDNNGTTLIASNNRFLGIELPEISQKTIPPSKLTENLYQKLPGFSKNYWYATEPIKGEKWQIMILKSPENANYQYWLLLVILLIIYIFIAIMHGISRNNEYLYEYKAAQMQFKLLFDYAPDSVFVVSALTQKIIEANHQTNLLFGKTDSLVGIEYDSLLAEESKENSISTYSVVGVFRQECKLKKLTGEKFVGEITGSRLTFNGEDAWMIILHDITTHKKIEEQLKEANALKGRFFANASHEIRTPMTAIIGLTELAVSLCNNDRQRHTIELIRSSAKAMLNLINDILDLSELESGKFQLEPIQFNLHLLLMDLSEIIRFRAESPKDKNKLEISNNVPETIIADPERIRQILINLINNTLNHNENATIKIVAEIEETKQRDDMRLIISIIDKDRFLNAEEIEGHFNAFTYADPYSMDEEKTSRLGLAIAKQIVDTMGGTITIESDKEDGTAFIVSLLVKKAKTNQSQNPRDEILSIKLIDNNRPLRFLVADDNEINLFVATSIIEKYKGVVVSAKDGEEVLTILNQDDKGFDCLLIDIQMPKLDGLSVIKNIRNSQEAYKNTPILAISAFASQQEAITVQDAGAEAYLNKPYFPEDLIGILKDILNLQSDSTYKEFKAPEPSHSHSLVHINQKELELRLLKQPNDIIKICEIYSRRYEDLLATINESLKNNSSPQMREVAHSIRGLAEMLSAKAVASLAKNAEDLAKSEKTTEAAQLLDTLKAKLAEINTDLQNIKSSLLP